MIQAGSAGGDDKPDVFVRTVAGMGYELVDVERTSGGLLRVTIDRKPGQTYATGPGDAVLVDDCEAVTRQLQYVLEVEGVDYHRLEVSSPGVDRPLRTPQAAARFVGHEVEVTLREAFQGRRKWRGELRAGEGPTAWRLVLPDADEVAAKQAPRGRPGHRPPARVVPKPDAERQALDFDWDEMREMRLVPVLDFKGRRLDAAPAAQVDDRAAAPAPHADGERT